MGIEYEAIGRIHTPFTETEGMPIQPAGAKGAKGTVEVYSKYQDGLKDVDGFSHIILLYDFHRGEGYKLQIRPFMDEELRGVFATRAPKRPNAIGISVVRLKGIEGNILRIENVDMLDGTPLLDIKPYVPEFDFTGEAKTGWLESVRKTVGTRRADGRFG